MPVQAVEAVADIYAADAIEGRTLAVEVVGAQVADKPVMAGFGTTVGKVLRVDAIFAWQEGEEEVCALLFEYGLQFGKAAHALKKDMALFVAGDKKAIGIKMVETSRVVFIDKPRLEKVVVLPHNNGAGVGGAVVGCPEVLVVEADGGFAEAVVVFDVLVGGFLPFARQDGSRGELRFFCSDVDTFEGLDLDEGGGSLQNGEQEETEGHEAEYLGCVAHGVRIGNR